MNRLLPIVAVVALLLLAYLAWRSNNDLTANLPPKQVYATKNEAFVAALSDGQVGTVLGTGSMAPFIPASAAGLDPLKTTVAYVTFTDANFADVQKGNLCTYEPESAPGSNWIHLAAEKDSGGWIMTGLANAHYENWMRMTAKGFRGVVRKVYTWPQ